MIRNIAILTAHDLAVAFRNKTLYLVLFIPLFVFFALQMIDGAGDDTPALRLGLIADANYAPLMIASLRAADPVLLVSSLADMEAGRRWLRDREGDGLLVPSTQSDGTASLVVLSAASVQTVALVDAVSRLQRRLESTHPEWIADVQALQEGGLQAQMLPTWTLMLVLLIAFIVLPPQVAEEKERKLLLGLLQTPMHEADWLLAKAAYGVILMLAAVLLLHLLTGLNLSLPRASKYLALLLAGAFCFSACGVLVGFLCRTQASARTLGVLFYLPHLLPSALADFSSSLNSVAPFIPSYQLYRPMRLLLLDAEGGAHLPGHILFLLASGLLASLATYLLMRRRWLM